MRPNVKFENVAELFLYKQAELSRLQPQCRCLSNSEALVGVGVLVFLIGMVTGMWLCQTYWR